MPESPSHFVRIDRERGGTSRHYVVHTGHPPFTLELTPEADAGGPAAKGVLKRLCVPNSWAGDYGKYARLIAAAEEFFAQSAVAAEGSPPPRLSNR